MVMLHIVLLLVQIAVLYESEAKTDVSATTLYKFQSTNFVTTAVLDIFVSGLICLMLHDFNFETRFKPDAQPVVTSSSEGSTSRDSDETPEDKSVRQIQRFQRDWVESFHSDNSYDLDRVEFHQCIKAAALFLNEYGLLDSAIYESSSGPSDASSDEQPNQLVWEPLVLTNESLSSLDLNASATSIN
jgi:hypothetical protein